MAVRPPAIVLLVVLLPLAACSDHPEPTRTAHLPTVTTTTATTHRPSPHDIVDDPESALLDARVVRKADGFRVASSWRLMARGRDAIAVSDDGFATAEYANWSQKAYDAMAASPTPSEVDVPALAGLITWPAASLADGVQAVIGGGDGATLFPFQKVARSTDGGSTWTSYDVPLSDGEQAYSAGHVVLADGRVLALLDHWSDDRPKRPSDRHHGLYVSDGDDWSSFAPLHPRFIPRLGPTPEDWPPLGFSSLVSLQGSADHGGVVWVSTWDARLYVSTDGATTFREIAAR